MFTIVSGNKKLSGVLHLPEELQGRKVPLLIFLHGFIGSKVGEHRIFVKAARYFTKRGFGVFRFDFSGCGESDGDYQDVTVSRQLIEVQAVINEISKHEAINSNEIILVGHSLGGAIAALTAAEDARIEQLVLWSAVGNPYKDITDIIGEKAVEEAANLGVVDYKGFYISERFLEDLKSHQPVEQIVEYSGAACIVHAGDDEDVPKEHTNRYIEALQSRTQTADIHSYFIHDADHTFSSYTFEQQLFDVTYDWLRRNELASIAQ